MKPIPPDAKQLQLKTKLLEDLVDTEETIEKIRDILSKPRSWVDRAIFRVTHIAKWIPVLWNDHNWDHSYLLIIMRHKVRMMREHHEKIRQIGDWRKVARQMKNAEKILTRLIEDEYGMKGYLAIRKKFPRTPMSEWLRVPGGIQMPQSSPAELVELRKNWKLEDETRNGDLKELGRIFLEEVRGWWD